MKRHTFLAQIILSILVLMFSVTCAIADSPAPIAHWKLDEGGGTVALDDSGNGYNGTLEPNPPGEGESLPTWVSGKIDGALEFTQGGHSYVDCGTDPALCPTSEITAAAWVYVRGESQGNGIILIKQGPQGSSTASYSLIYDVDGEEEEKRFAVGIETEYNTWAGYYSSTTAALEKWYHVAFTYTSGSLKLYINGQLDKEWVGEEAPTGEIDLKDGHFMIGKEDSWPVEYFWGMIDDVRLYNTVLSAEEISDICGRGPIAHWKFDEGSGTVAVDVTGNGYDGTLGPNPPGEGESMPTWVPGKIGGALEFTQGGHSYVDCGTEGTNGLCPTSAITAAAWVYVRGESKGNGIILIKQGQASGTQELGEASYSLIYDVDGEGEGKFAVGLQTEGNPVWDDYHSKTTAILNRWHHVAFTYTSTPTSGLLRIYIDGEFDKEWTNVTGPIKETEELGAFLIGKEDSWPVEYFWGLIDDVRLYNRDLSEQEISELYDYESIFYVSPSGDDCSDPDCGTADKPFKTINHAVSMTIDDDMVVVMPGTYAESITVFGKSITITGTNPDDWDIIEDTIIDPTADGGPGSDYPGIKTYTSDADVTIEGLTIQNADVGIFVVGGSEADISKCILSENDTGIMAFLTEISVSSCKVLGSKIVGINLLRSQVEAAKQDVKNSLISGSTFDGILINGADHNITIRNNTIGGNANAGINVASGERTNLAITNCIIYGNGSGTPLIGIGSNDPAYPTYSCFENATGETNTAVEPIFETDGYHLSEDSEYCIDKGDPGFDYDDPPGEIDLDGQIRIFRKHKEFGRVDIGADEFCHDLYVKTTGHDDADGKTWDTALATIQEGVNSAGGSLNAPLTVYVKTGHYTTGPIEVAYDGTKIAFEGDVTVEAESGAFAVDPEKKHTLSTQPCLVTIHDCENIIIEGYETTDENERTVFKMQKDEYAPAHEFNTDDVDTINNTIRIPDHKFKEGAQVRYYYDKNPIKIWEVDKEVALPRAWYYIVSAKIDTVKLAKTEGGNPIDLYSAPSEEYHLLSGGEGRHVIRVTNCKDIEIRNVELKDSGGDGIWLGRDYIWEGEKKENQEKFRNYNENVTISNVICDNIYRNAIAVASVDGLLIENCNLNNTRGVDPESGIDFEPTRGHPDCKLKNIVVRNIEATNNTIGILVSLHALDGTSDDIDLVFEDILINNAFNGSDVYNATKGFGIDVAYIHDNEYGGSADGTINFNNVTIENAYKGILARKSRDNVNLTFTNCVIRDSIFKNIEIAEGTGIDEPGGVTFNDCQVVDNQNRPVIETEYYCGTNCYGIGYGEYADDLYEIYGTIYLLNNDYDPSPYYDWNGLTENELHDVEIDDEGHIITGLADFCKAFNRTTFAWYPSIQDAIDAASDGDVIEVMPDTHTENITFDGSKTITVRGMSPGVTEDTIITANDDVVSFLNGDESILKYITVEGGTTGIYCKGSSPTVNGCIIRNNSSSGIWCNRILPEGESSSSIITNCIIYGNSLGGICISWSEPDIRNCTIVDNGTGHPEAGGIYGALNGELPTITNCILWDNDSQDLDAGFTATYSCIEDGDEGQGNIGGSENNPLFVNPAEGDYHLQVESPCINAGAPGDYEGQIDIDGDRRVFGDGVDMGSDEFTTAKSNLFVDVDADAGGSGLSWGTAYNDLQDALAVAQSGDQIWVAVGTYKPDDTDKTVSFELVEDVAVYGGFVGSETSLNERNLSNPANETILNGDIDDDGLDLGNSQHVVKGADGAVLDGFTVKQGYADDSSNPYLPDAGGGMFNAEVSPIVRNCIFTENNALAGGGVCNVDSLAEFINCVFKDNCPAPIPAMYGSGMYCSNSANSNIGPAVTNCLFTRNYSAFGGDGIYIKDSSPKITNCTISGNGGVLTSGGALHFAGSGGPEVTNCILWGNDYGSEIYIEGSSINPVINYCDIKGGWATGTGNIGEDQINHDPDFATDGYHLTLNSPCIDAGSPYLNYDGQVDIDGQERVNGDYVDMGADEYHP
ncbi:MAG: right-handed parallel beta-helix repeat-containing protein [Sedimentisphaerales bacterium]|nr:right-handed parallel beta-helix repeat-containing protein [Sedimentisphaerales bacterium]